MPTRRAFAPIFMLSCLILCDQPVLSQSVQSSPKHATPHQKRHSPKHQSIADRLARTTSVTFKRIPAHETFDWLRKETGLNVVVRWRALNRVGVYEDDPVWLMLNDVSMGDILTETLRQLSDDLRWRAMDNTITVSTMEDFSKDLYTVVYDVKSLLQDNPDYLHKIRDENGCWSYDVEESHLTRAELLDMMAEAITENVLPETWNMNGGEGSLSIIESQMKFVIRNCPEVHMTLSDDFTIPNTITPVAPRTEESAPQSPAPRRR